MRFFIVVGLVASGERHAGGGVLQRLDVLLERIIQLQVLQALAAYQRGFLIDCTALDNLVQQLKPLGLATSCSTSSRPL
jgi:hypothetical protein